MAIVGQIDLNPKTLRVVLHGEDVGALVLTL